MSTMNIDLKRLRNFGLSLNSNKNYFLVYEPCTWTLMGVYDNVEDAVNNCWDGSTVNSYQEKCANARYDKDGIKYDENYIGHNYPFCKGFFQNINMWGLLEMLCRDVKEDMLHYEEEYVSCLIDSKLQSSYLKT